MPRVSRSQLKIEVRKELKENFADLVSSLSKKSDIEDFFSSFLTKEEDLMLTKRLMMHLMLENGYKDSQIHSVLGVSRETIRVHRELWERGGPVYKELLSKLAKKEKTREFLKNLARKLRPLDDFLGAKNDMKARARFISGENS